MKAFLKSETKEWEIERFSPFIAVALCVTLIDLSTNHERRSLQLSNICQIIEGKSK